MVAKSADKGITRRRAGAKGCGWGQQRRVEEKEKKETSRRDVTLQCNNLEAKDTTAPKKDPNSTDDSPRWLKRKRRVRPHQCRGQKSARGDVPARSIRSKGAAERLKKNCRAAVSWRGLVTVVRVPSSFGSCRCRSRFAGIEAAQTAAPQGQTTGGSARAQGAHNPPLWDPVRMLFRAGLPLLPRERGRDEMLVRSLGTTNCVGTTSTYMLYRRYW